VRPVNNILVELEIAGGKNHANGNGAGRSSIRRWWRRLARRFPRCLDGREDRGRRSARAIGPPMEVKNSVVARAELARTHGVMSAARFADKITVDVPS